jgi:hypothetical protein
MGKGYEKTEKQILLLKTCKKQGGEINQALYAHMNNKRKIKKKKKTCKK